MKEILITSSILITVILLLRVILGKLVSRRLIYAIWLLVAVRLLIPVQFGQFQYSVISVTEKLEQQSTLIQQVQDDLHQPLVEFDQEALYSQLLQQYQSQTETPIPPAVQAQLQQQAQERSSVTPVQVLTILWISGAVVLAGWFLITNLLFLHKTQRDSIVFDPCVSPIPVRISTHVSTPCLAGLFRPRIYLTPESTADPQTLNHVLTHELTHLKHRDHIWAWVRCLCLCIYWFDPLVWVAAIVSKRDCELACDEAALNKLGEDQRIPYGHTLLATVTHSSIRIFHTTTAMSESGKQLKERVSFIVKKPKTLLIAAVCLILATTVTAAMVFSGCGIQNNPVPQSTSPNQPKETEPNTVPVTTEPTTTQPSTNPVAQKPKIYFESAPDILHIIPPLSDTPTEAYETVKDALLRYTRYGLEGICCDSELIVADLSQYLTEEQKQDYCCQQYRITCCKNAQQVRDHIDRCLGKELRRNGDPDGKLFTDGDGNLYTIINPTCYNGYGHIEVISQTKSKIVARACQFDEDGCYRTARFTLRSGNQGYQITNVEEDKDYHCETSVVDQGSHYQVLQFGNGHYGYKFYDHNGELRSHNWTEYRRPIITPITEDIMELAISYGPGHVNRSYRSQSRGYWESYDYVVALGYGKIAYLDGEPDNRVLVVCDLFDRSKSETFEYLGFAPEAMPVTKAAFTSDGSDWRLTLTYRIGENTETTWSTLRTLEQ